MSTYSRLLYRRIASSWRLFVALAVGTTISAALMAATVIYADALENLGLEFAFNQSSPTELNVLAGTSARINDVETPRAANTLQEAMSQNLGSIVTEQVRSLKSGTMYIAPAGEPIDIESELRPRAFIQTRTALEQHVTVEGRLPAPSDGPAIEVAIGAPAADRLGVSLGDQFDVLPFWNLEIESQTLEVVGIVEPIDAESDYWTGALDAFDVRSTRWDTFAFFGDEETLVDRLAVAFPAMPGDVNLLGRVDVSRIEPEDVPLARAALAGFESRVRDQLSVARVSSGLPQTLADFDERLTFSRIPLYLIAVQVVGMAVFYLVMVSSMHVEQQAGEIALLKSRGGTSRQVLQLYLGEGAVLLAVALLLAPLLAALAVALLGKTPVFDDLTGNSLLEVSIGPLAYLVALAGALAAIVALIIPAWTASRRTIVEFKRSAGRPSVAAFIFRYYIDLAVVAVLGMLLFQLQDQGSLASRNVFGELETDPVLLVTPALFFLVCGFLFLRLFPLLLWVIGHLVNFVASTSLALAFAHLVRNPTRYGLLIILLVLATSLGMFAATFGSTLNTNLRDRARYEAGANVRYPSLRPSSVDHTTYDEALEGAPGIESHTTLMRQGGSLRLNAFNSVSAEVIGIDDRLAETAYFRDDFAGPSLAEITESVNAGQFTVPRGPTVPEGSDALAIRVFAGPASSVFAVHVQLRDGANKVHDLTLMPYDEDGMPIDLAPRGLLPGEEPAWYLYAAPVSEGIRQARIDPVTVEAVSVRRPFRQGDDRTTLLFDDLRAFTWDDAAVPVDSLPGAPLVSSFEEPADWEVATGQTRVRLSDRLTPTGDNVYHGETALAVSWTEPVSPIVQRGFRTRGPNEPVPIAASTSLLEQSGFAVGDQVTLFSQGSYIQMVVVSELTLFPTISDPAADPFLLVDQDVFAYMASRTPGSFGGPGVSELWIRASSSGADPAAIAALLPAESDEVILLRDALFEREQDPLAVAGWQGILLLSFGAVLLLSAIGFVLFAYLSAQSRRLEFGVLRTIGLTRGQVGISVAVEQVIVVALGVAAGSLIALQLGPQMIDFLGFTDSGETVIPPYRNVTDWTTLGLTYGTILAVFVGATVAIIALYLREAIHRVLRLGEL